jgi:hypothetical protein
VKSFSEIWGGKRLARTFRTLAMKASTSLKRTFKSVLAGRAGPEASQVACEPGVHTHELPGQDYGVFDAVAQSVRKAVLDAKKREPPKLLGQRKPAPPAIEAALLEQVMTSDDH